jgi:transcriptional regulator with XRE-family HTH domain
MKRERSEYDSFEASSRENRRLQRQEKLIVEVTEAIAKVLNESNISQAELARRLGTTKGYVSQLLNGGRNLTLRTLADVSDALHCVVDVCLKDQAEFHQRSEIEVDVSDRWRRDKFMGSLVEFRPRSQPKHKGSLAA